MTVSTSMVLHMYGYTENKEMNEWINFIFKVKNYHPI